MNQLTVGIWAAIDESCPITCSISGSNLAQFEREEAERVPREAHLPAELSA